MVEIDRSLIEFVAPSQIRTGDILLVISDLQLRHGYQKGIWGDVRDIVRFPKDSQCSIEKGTIHAFDAFHFTCDIYDDTGSQIQPEKFCYPMFIHGRADGGRPVPVKVERSVQR